MRLRTSPYLAQDAAWPATGRHIVAQYDADTVVVYQAYRPAIGRFAAAHGYFGGDFSYGRMSWLKPNFLWMMYRSGWGTKEDQEVTLAINLQRDAFDQILASAVHSNFVGAVYGTREAWHQAVAASDVRLQWDPDHSPAGSPLERRAIQLGLRGETLKNFGKDWIVAIEDISDFVAEQREFQHAALHHRLVTPAEAAYPVTDPGVAGKLGVESAM